MIVALLLFSGCVPAEPGRHSWAVSSLEGKVISRNDLEAHSCYILALCAWDSSSKASLAELRRIVDQVCPDGNSRDLPALLFVYFDSSKSDIGAELSAWEGLPFPVALGTSDTAKEWALEVVPTLYYWNGNSLAVRHRGYIEADCWRSLLKLGDGH